jgi:hypothetical protein
MEDGVPERIFDAACEGDLAEVEAFLASVAAPRDVVNCIDPAAPSRNVTLLRVTYFGRPFGPRHARLVSLLISHGANVNQIETDGASPLINVLAYWSDNCSWKAVIDMVSSLLSAGANVNWGGRYYGFPIAMVVEKLAKRLHPDSAVLAEVVNMLLRAGASVDSSSEGKLSGSQTMRILWDVWDRAAIRGVRDPRCAKLVADPHVNTIKAQIDGVHAAGSWRAYIMAPRLEVLTLRGLANRGKIRSADPALNNLVALPNELICQVLAFWFG